jgi:hypothetical protein
MRHEISQFDIPDRQLFAASAQPRADRLMDIGEAKITHTIFGRARVRVTHERDKKRRAGLLAALAAMAIATAVWQGWIAWQQMLSAPPPLPLSERIRVSAPVFQPETITLPDVRSSGKNISESLIQTEINSMVSSPNMLQKRPPGLNATNPMAAKPVAVLPLTASRLTPLATDNNSSKNQTDMQQPPSLSDPIQPIAPAIATPSARKPAANKPAVVAPLVGPLIKGDAPTLSPAGNNQPPEPVNVQPQVNVRP